MQPGYASSSSSYTQQGYQPNNAPSSYSHAPPPMSTISSASWDPHSHSTFPGPRRASNQALAPPVGESTIAPGSHRHAPIDPRHGHAHGHGKHDDVPQKHHSHHKSHSRAASTVDDWDTRSDASYYARPKNTRSRSGSSLSDITTTKRHHYGTPKGSPGLRGHSPSSPSPLARGDLDLAPGSGHLGRSPLSPRSQLGFNVDQRKGRKISDLGLGGESERHGHSHGSHASPYKPITPITRGRDYSPAPSGNERDLSTLHEGEEKRHRHHSASFDGDRKPKSVHGHGQGQGYASDDESRRSAHAHRERERERGRAREHDRDRLRHGYEEDTSTTASKSRRDRSARPGKNRAEAYPNDENDEGYDDRHHHHHHHREDRDESRSQTQSHSHSHKHHHRPRSHSHVPPPLPYRHPSPSPDPYQQHQTQVQNSLQVPQQYQGMPDMGGLSLGRRRAHSMQPHAIVPSPGSLAGYGAGGEGGYAGGPGSAMGGMGGMGGSMGGGVGPGMGNMGGMGGMSGGMGGPTGGGMGMGMEGYEDGGSVAGSAMTFMDGAMGGKTSQYGLPKYPHQAKPDPRR